MHLYSDANKWSDIDASARVLFQLRLLDLQLVVREVGVRRSVLLQCVVERYEVIVLYKLVESRINPCDV
jgi:hypothetical protein